MTTASDWQAIKAKKAALRARGICSFRIGCGQPAKAGGMCLACREKWRDEQSRYRAPWESVKAKRAELKAAGLCTYRVKCGCKIFRAGKCKRHWAERREFNRQWQAETYHAKKAAGVCVVSGCKCDMVEGTTWCQQHREEKASRERRINKLSPERRKATWRASQKRLRARREELGQCVICKQPTVTRQLCEKHREERRAISKRNRPKKTDRVWRCSLCRREGHFAPCCPNVRDVQRISIDEIATRGWGSWAA